MTRLSRRGFLATAAVTAVVASTGTAAAEPARPTRAGRFDQPRQGFTPASTVLRHGTPQQIGLDPQPIRAALAQLDGWTENDPVTGHPLYSGQVTLLAQDGVIVAKDAAGYALRYADQQGDPLPATQQIPMRTRHDLRSGIAVQAVHLRCRDAADPGRHAGRERDRGELCA